MSKLLRQFSRKWGAIESTTQRTSPNFYPVTVNSYGRIRYDRKKPQPLLLRDRSGSDRHECARAPSRRPYRNTPEHGGMRTKQKHINPQDGKCMGTRHLFAGIIACGVDWAINQAFLWMCQAVSTPTDSVRLEHALGVLSAQES